VAPAALPSPVRTSSYPSRAPVAQLDRAPDYESGGQEFESLRARQLALFMPQWSLRAQMPMKKSSVVHSDPDILGGTPVFVGTRVPVQGLIDYIEGGHSLNQFLDDFPTVTRELAIAALEQGKLI